MFFTFQSSESRSRKMRKKTIISKRKERLYTIYIDCLLLTGKRYRVEIDSRKSITELYEKIKKSITNNSTKSMEKKRIPKSQIDNSFELKVVYGSKLLFNKNSTFIPNEISPTIGNYFGITEKQLRVLAINRAKNKNLEEQSLLNLHVILIKNPEIKIIEGHTKLYILDGTTNQIENGKDVKFTDYVQSLNGNSRRLEIIQNLLEKMKKRITDNNNGEKGEEGEKEKEMLKRIDEILTLIK